MLEARKNLKAAIGVIDDATARIATLEASAATDPADLAAERERRARAEEVRAVCALRILGDAVDDQARELLNLNVRRRQLAESIHGFLKLDVANGQVCPVTSRLMSAALLHHPMELENSTDPITGATEVWKTRLEALFADPDANL